MSALPRYAFIKLDPVYARRNLYVDLSEFGDVRLMSKISEVADVVTELIASAEMGGGIQRPPAANTKKPKVDRRVPTKQLLSPGTSLTSHPGTAAFLEAAAAAAAAKRPRIITPSPSEMIARPPSTLVSLSTPVPPPSSTTAETLPLFSDAPIDSSPKVRIVNRNGIATVIKAEDESGEDEPPTANGIVKMEEGDVIELGDEEEETEEPGPSFAPLDQDTLGGVEQYVDGAGNVELPYNPDFYECRRGKDSTSLDERREDSAQCDVCRRWVRTTKTLSRLVAHVFMHAQKQRYLCPIRDCDYSHRILATAHSHIQAAHPEFRNKEPIDVEDSKNRVVLSATWKSDRARWAPRCFPDHFETAPGGEIFMKVSGKSFDAMC